MTIIGITGGTGGGKTSALRALRSFGALVIDCDALYHELLLHHEDMMYEISARFTGAVTDGALDRKALGRIVFSDSAALGDLNAITHKYVSQEVDQQLSNWEDAGGTLAAVDAVALIESGLSDMCDITVAVTAPEDIRVKRIMARDGVSEDYARLRAKIQKPNKFFIENCDYVLVNDCATAEQFEEKCIQFFTRILGGTSDA